MGLRRPTPSVSVGFPLVVLGRFGFSACFGRTPAAQRTREGSALALCIPHVTYIGMSEGSLYLIERGSLHFPSLSKFIVFDDF